MKKSAHTPGSVRRLEDIPNVGCAVADELRALGITAPIGLVGRDPWALYAQLNALRGLCHDPCLLDTFIAATRFMADEPARPWWHYTAERKARQAASKD